jgi:hypothetical protein
LTPPTHRFVKRTAAVAPPSSGEPSSEADELSGSGAAGLCATGLSVGALPGLRYPPADCATLVDVRFATPPTELRNVVRTPTRARASTASNRPYSITAAPASQVRNRRLSCRTETPVRSREITKTSEGDRDTAGDMPRQQVVGRGEANYLVNRVVANSAGAVSRRKISPPHRGTMQALSHSATTRR